MNQRNIIAIGGGNVETGETLSIDRIFAARAGKERPTVLFIPTASGDAPDYADSIRSTYEDRLGGVVEVLNLLTPGYDLGAIERADVIYVGGGNTKAMLETWRETGVAELLTRQVALGKPVGGLSAGSICWFRAGNSDWPQYEGIEGVNTARLDGLNLVDLSVCPHTKDEAFRLGEFRETMRTEGGIGIGLDDCCALEIVGDTYRILASQPDCVAHRIEWVKGELTERALTPHDDFRPLDTM